MPWARFDLQSHSSARTSERNPQANLGGKQENICNNCERSLFSTAFSSSHVLSFPRDLDNATQMLLWLSL